MSGQEHQPGKQTGAAERMRRYRARRRSRIRCFRGDVSCEVVDALVRNGWLKDNEAADPNRLGKVMADVADCWVRGTLAADP